MPATYDELGNYGIQQKRLDVENSFHLPEKAIPADDSVNTDDGALLYINGTDAFTEGLYAKLNGSWVILATGTGAFVNGGNSFGASASLGTIDNNNLAFKVNNVNRAVYDAAGDAYYYNDYYQLKNATGTGHSITVDMSGFPTQTFYYGSTKSLETSITNGAGSLRSYRNLNSDYAHLYLDYNGSAILRNTTAWMNLFPTMNVGIGVAGVDYGSKLRVQGNSTTYSTIYAYNEANTPSTFIPLIEGNSAYHSSTARFQIGTYDYATAFLSYGELQFAPMYSYSPSGYTLALRNQAIPSAGGIRTQDSYGYGVTGQYIDFRGGILGDGWKVFIPEGIWNYSHTSFPYQLLRCDLGSSTNPDFQFNSYSQTNIVRGFGTTGNVGIGTGLDAGYKLDVNGTLRTASTLTQDNHVQIYTGQTHPSVLIGKNLGTPPSTGRNHIRIGRDISVTDAGVENVFIGSGLTDNTGGNYKISIGQFNTNTSSESSNIQIGNFNTSNFTFFSADLASIQIGKGNVLNHGGSITIGSNLTSTANGQLIFGISRANMSVGYEHVYFTNGISTLKSTGEAKSTHLHASGANITVADVAGGDMYIEGGLNTGNNTTGGNVYITTPTAGASGTTVQTASNRMKVEANTGHVLLYNVPVYADNAAAISGGLATGTIYKTSTGVLMIVY